MRGVRLLENNTYRSFSYWARLVWPTKQSNIRKDFPQTLRSFLSRSSTSSAFNVLSSLSMSSAVIAASASVLSRLMPFSKPNHNFADLAEIIPASRLSVLRLVDKCLAQVVLD